MNFRVLPSLFVILFFYLLMFSTGCDGAATATNEENNDDSIAKSDTSDSEVIERNLGDDSTDIALDTLDTSDTFAVNPGEPLLQGMGVYTLELTHSSGYRGSVSSSWGYTKAVGISPDFTSSVDKYFIDSEEGEDHRLRLEVRDQDVLAHVSLQGEVIAGSFINTPFLANTYTFDWTYAPNDTFLIVLQDTALNFEEIFGLYTE